MTDLQKLFRYAVDNVQTVLYGVRSSELKDYLSDYQVLELPLLQDNWSCIRIRIPKTHIVLEGQSRSQTKRYTIYLVEPYYEAVCVDFSGPIKYITCMRDCIADLYERLYPNRQCYDYDMMGLPIQYVDVPEVGESYCPVSIHSSMIRPGTILTFQVKKPAVHWQVEQQEELTLLPYVHLDLGKLKYHMTYHGKYGHSMILQVSKPELILDVRVGNRIQDWKVSQEVYFEMLQKESVFL